MLGSSRSSSAFPPSFLFGVATADHQCEAYDPRFEDIRDVWERKRNLTERKKATDFWNRYAGDIQLARDLGCNSFRFSLAWSRLEPAPGQFNDEAFAHYQQLIETIQAACDRGGQAIWPAGALLDHVQRADPTYLWLHQALVGAILLYATWSAGKCDV